MMPHRRDPLSHSMVTSRPKQESGLYVSLYECLITKEIIFGYKPVTERVQEVVASSCSRSLHERFYLVQHLCEAKWPGNERINPGKLLKSRKRVRKRKDDHPAARARGEGYLDLLELLTESCFAGLRAIKEDEPGSAALAQHVPGFYRCCTPQQRVPGPTEDDQEQLTQALLSDNQQQPPLF
jgi:hypothetical protein